MLKRLILTLILICSFSNFCFAETISPVIIQNASTEEVSDMIAQVIALRSQGKASITASTPNSLTLMSILQVKQGLLGIPCNVERYISFTFAKTPNGIILNASQTARLENSSTLIPANVDETSYILKSIKSLFDGRYTFGFDCEKNKHNGGYKITSIVPGGAFDKAGFKVNDILIKVDNITVKGGYYEFFPSSKCHIDSLKEQSMPFTVKRNNTVITQTATSSFESADKVRASTLVPR